MKLILKQFYPIGLSIVIFSCGGASKLISKYQGPQTQVKFFETEKQNGRKWKFSFYAKVDSNNVQTFYEFIPNGNIYKIYKNNKGLVYTLVYNMKPAVYFSAIDSFVFNKANYIIDSLGRKDLRKTKGATGFVIEVNYH